MKAPRMMYDRVRPKIVIPDGFTLIQDTQEKKPIFKPAEYIINRHLKTGDYSMVGFEEVITIERKSKPDLFGSIYKARFKRCIARMLEMEWKALMIEGTEDFTMRKTGYSSVEINPLYHQLASWETAGIHIYFSKGKRDAQDWILTRLIHFFRHKREGRDEKSDTWKAKRETT